MGEAGLPAAKWLVYTHHHWDHVWGACAWDDVEIVGHSAGAALLATEATRPWSHEYLRQQVAAEPLLGPSFRARARAMPSWEDFRIIPAHGTFDAGLDLPTGVRLRHVGGQHAPDSIVVAVPDSGVLLLGDCFYPPPWHLRTPDDTQDLEQVRGLLDEQYEWYVDAHSSPWRRSEGLRFLAAG
jgi:glyoxylase-like metal-dependent hydrolase (beta-lactamase superfamily II)